MHRKHISIFVFETGSVRLQGVTAQAMSPVVSPPITAYPAAHWLSVTRVGWRLTYQTQSARETTSLVRGLRRLITVAGKVVSMYLCACLFFLAFIFCIYRIGRPPKYRKNQQRDYQSKLHCLFFVFAAPHLKTRNTNNLIRRFAC